MAGFAENTLSRTPRIAAAALLAIAAVALTIALAPARAFADGAQAVTFEGISGASLGSPALDTVTVGNNSITSMDPEVNVLYLPASADAASLRYRIDGYSMTSSAVSSDASSGTGMPLDEPSLTVSSDGLQPTDAQAFGEGSGSGDSRPGGRQASSVQDAAGIEPCLTVSEPAGTLDLSSVAMASDAAGMPFWLVAFRPDAWADPTLVYIYWDYGLAGSIDSLFLTTTNGMPWIEADKSNRDPGGAAALVGADASISYEGVLSEMKGRGNSTWRSAKKAYQIKLAKKASLIDGAESAKTWVLATPSFDASLIRTAASMALASASGLEFTPKCKQVHLYVDGGYRGVYTLIEKVQVNGARVNIADLEDANKLANPGIDIPSLAPTVLTKTAGTEFSRLSAVSFYPIASPADVTGGYLVEMEIESRLEPEDSYFKTKRGVCFVVKGPSEASRAEMAYISTYFQDLEDAIFSSTGRNAAGKHYSEYIDVNSLATYYAVQELLANHDGFKSSTFFYKDASGKLKAGPLWDCDRTLGGVMLDLVRFEDPSEILVTDPNRKDAKPQWICTLMERPDFQSAVKVAYSQKVAPAARRLLNGGLALLSAPLEAAHVLDDVRWSGHRAAGEFPYTVIKDAGSWAGATATARSFLQARLSALSSKIGVPVATIEPDPAPDPAPDPTPNPTPGPAVTPVSFERLWGADRYATMAAVNARGFAKGSSPTVIVTSGTAFPDALNASALAGMLQCPIVTTAPGSLSAKASSELRRLGASRVYILGGTSAVSQRVEQSIKALGVGKVTRIGGADRFATCVGIYNLGRSLGKWSDTCIVASGQNFADAMSVGPYAYAAKAPIFIVSGGRLTSAEVSAIRSGGFKKVIVVGGDAAVDYRSLSSTLGGGFSYQRLYGADRYETSRAIADWSAGLAKGAAFQPAASARLSYRGMAIADGRNFPDALVAAPLLGKSRSVLQLVSDSREVQAIAARCKASHAKEMGRCYALGGTAAVPEKVVSWFK